MYSEGQHEDYTQTTSLKLTNNQIAYYCDNIPFGREICDVCGGSGSSGDGTCSSCNGSGEI